MTGAVEAFVAPQLSAIRRNGMFQDQEHDHDSSFSLQKIIQLGNLNHCPQSSSTALLGIPKMFRWLTDQYPNINSRLSEGLSSDKLVDNFYLDMNGIIHPCTHGNSDELVILDETAMFKKIFGYVDRLVLLCT
jgi:5'-3' exoribonuclease 1